MKRITNKKTGESWLGEVWLSEIKDNLRNLKLELKDVRELKNFVIEDVPEEIKPWEEVAVAKWRTGDLKIASEDYYEILPDGTKKTEFTWDEAMEIEKKTDGKWRLPTSKEFAQMVLTYGLNEEGVFEGKRFAKALNLTTDENGWGNFWSCTASSKPYARYLYFCGTGVNPQLNGAKVYGFAVRCVAQ